MDLLSTDSRGDQATSAPPYHASQQADSADVK